MLSRSSHCSTRNISAIPCQMHPSSHTSAVWTLCAPLSRSAIPGRTHHWAKEHCTRTRSCSIKVPAHSVKINFFQVCTHLCMCCNSAPLRSFMSFRFGELVQQVHSPTVTQVMHCFLSRRRSSFHDYIVVPFPFPGRKFLPSKFLHPASQGCHRRASLSWPWQGTSHSCQPFEHS